MRKPPPVAVVRFDSGNLGAQDDLGAELGQQGRTRVAVQLAQRERGDPDVGRVVLAEQAGLDHHGGQRQRGVVARDVQRRDGEQVPQRPAGPLVLPPLGEPVAEPLRVRRRVGRVDAAHGQRRASHRHPFGEGKKRIPAEGRQHMQRAGERGPAEPGLTRPAVSSRSEDGHVEPVLQRGVLRHAEPGQQAAVGRAAAQEDVLTGVDGQAVPAERARRAAEPGPGLEQGDVGARFRERDSGGDSGQPPADHRDSDSLPGGLGGIRVSSPRDRQRGHLILPARARTATMAFSPVDKETRLFRTAPGCAAIRSSRWR